MAVFAAQLINGIAIGAIYALLVLGVNLLIVVRGVVYFSYPHVVMVAMAAAWLVLKYTGDNLALAIPMFFVAATILMVLTEPLFRPLVKNGAFSGDGGDGHGHRHHPYRCTVAIREPRFSRRLPCRPSRRRAAGERRSGHLFPGHRARRAWKCRRGHRAFLVPLPDQAGSGDQSHGTESARGPSARGPLRQDWRPRICRRRPIWRDSSPCFWP